MEDTFDIAIVGLGPTGTVLANILGQMGWSVVGIEREEDIYFSPRAVHFDDEIMRIFQSIGLSDQISNSSESFKQMEFVLKPGDAPIATGLVGSQDARYGFNGAYWFHQPTLEKHLHEGLIRYEKISTYYGYEVVELVQNENHATLSIRKSKSLGKASVLAFDDLQSIKSKYVVGCDGGKSFVRRNAKLELESSDFDQPWIVVDTKTLTGKKDPELPQNHRQYCNPEQPVTYVPLAGPYYEWQFMVVDGKSEKEAIDPFYVRKLLKPYVDLSKVEITRIAYYKFHGLWAKRWRNNRIILAGDAAHQMPPFLGQGMCSGIRDATSLAWRLNLVLKGKASIELIDSYEKERYNHVEHIINGAILLGSIIQTTQKWKAILRNVFLFKPLAKSIKFRNWFTQKANRKMPLESGFLGENNRVAGHLFIQPLIVYNGKEILLDSLLGDDFALIVKSANTFKIYRNYDDSLFDLNLSLESPQFTISDQNLVEWFDESKIEFALVRPDKYIFDAGHLLDLPKVINRLNTLIPSAK